MGFIRKDTYKVPDFCSGCPAVEGMEQIEVRTTTNMHPPEVYLKGQFSEPLIYAHDPASDEAGEVILGENYMVDGFCNCCEYATSRALRVANTAVDACNGAKEVKYGLFKRKTKKVCGAGLEKDTLGRVRRLESIGRRQGRFALDAIDIVVKATARQK